jgi:hypothetical protein
MKFGMETGVKNIYRLCLLNSGSTMLQKVGFVSDDVSLLETVLRYWEL